jgi:hypothetical protein
MGRARDIASLFTTSSVLATDSEVAALGYLTNSSASSIYTPLSSPITSYKNKIINGGFDIWQRGTSFTGFGTAAYTADRWLVASNSATYTVTRQTSSTSEPIGSKYFARATATVAGTFDMNLCQPFESTVFDSLKGKNVTLSFYAKASTALTVNTFLNRNTSEGKVYYYEGTIINNTAFSLSTSWNRYSVTFAMPDKSVTNQGLQLSFQTAMTLNQYYDIWGIQLEEGSVATSFEQRFIGDELRMCQRYFYIQNSFGYFDGNSGNSTVARGSMKYAVTMRANPVITVFPQHNNGGTAGNVYISNINSNTSIDSVSQITVDGFDSISKSANFPSSTYNYACSYRADAEL